MSESLNSLIEVYHSLESQIIEAEGEITPEIEMLLASAEESIGEKLDGYAGFIAYCKGQVEYLKQEAEQYTSRAKMLSNTIETLRERMTFAMEQIGETKIKTPKHSFSLRKTESWRVREENITQRQKDLLVSFGCAEMVFKPSITELKKHYGAEAPKEFIEVTPKTSITIR